jgi:hypothetical protein
MPILQTFHVCPYKCVVCSGADGGSCVKVDFCASAPCSNGGTCQDLGISIYKYLYYYNSLLFAGVESAAFF